MSTQDAIETIKQYVTFLKSQGIPVTQTILFGSQAKGTANPWSDIDTCIVSPEFGHNRFDERIRLLHLTHEPYEMIEPHPYS